MRLPTITVTDGPNREPVLNREPGTTGLFRLYVAGPMTGLPEFNYPAFEAAAEALRAAGYEVESPTANGGKATDWRGYMRLGLAQAITCDGVALLPGWAQSKGAALEATVMWGLDLPVYPLEHWLVTNQGEQR